MSSSKSVEPTMVRQARYSVSLAFLLFGLALGLWFVHIPVVADRLRLEPAVLGLALLNLGLGSLICQPIAGIVVNRWGSKISTIAFLATTLIAFPAVINATNTTMLFVALFVAGAVVGATNVAVNTQASEIETARGRPSMSAFHGFFSLGVLCAAAAGGTMINLGWGDGSGAIAAGAVMLPLALLAGSWFLPDRGDKPAKAGKSGFFFPTKALMGLVVLAFLTNTIVFTVNDWSALFLSTFRGTSQGDAAIGVALFSAAMALSRFAGGVVVERLGARNVVVGGGVLAALGMVIVLSTEWVPLSISGFLLIGIGASNLAPLLMSQASRIPGVAPSMGVAATATGLTTGLLLGPPLIGFIAQGFTLPVALSTTILSGIIISLSALKRKWHAVSE